MRLCLLLCLGVRLFAQFPTTEERLQHYVHRTYSWQRLSFLGADSMIDHVLLDPRTWDRGPGGYWCRYSSGFGGRIVRNSIELGTGFVFQEDARYRPSKERGFLARVRFASSSALTAYDREGARHFAWSRLAGNAGGNLISSVWRPYRNDAGSIAEGVVWGYVGQVQNNLLSEFSPDMIRFGKKVRAKLLRR